jgi:hypothetical protein
MQQWEYLEVYIDSDEDRWRDSAGRKGKLKEARASPSGEYGLASLFNQLGTEGWDLVLKEPYSYVFKRPKQ